MITPESQAVSDPAAGQASTLEANPDAVLFAGWYGDAEETRYLTETMTNLEDYTAQLLEILIEQRPDLQTNLVALQTQVCRHLAPLRTLLQTMETELVGRPAVIVENYLRSL